MFLRPATRFHPETLKSGPSIHILLLLLFMLILPMQLRLDQHSTYVNGYYVTQVLSVVLKNNKKCMLNGKIDHQTSQLPSLRKKVVQNDGWAPGPVQLYCLPYLALKHNGASRQRWIKARKGLSLSIDSCVQSTCGSPCPDQLYEVKR
jgi:hypothetical protein